VRYLPILFFLAAPAWGALLLPSRGSVFGRAEGAKGGSADHPAPTGPRVEARAGRLTLPVAAAVSVAACVLMVGILTGTFFSSLHSSKRFGLRLPPSYYPTRFASYVRETGFAGRIFDNSSDGGYLAWAFPGVKPYMDALYVDLDVTRDYFAGLRDPRAFAALNRQYSFDGVLVKVAESPDLLSALLTDPLWTLAYGDLHRAFFVRSVSSTPVEIRPLAVYQGEDLSGLDDGKAAIQWVVSLVRLKRHDLLVEVLRQLDASPRIPSFVIQYALGYGMQSRDPELVARGRGMYPRMFSRSPEDRNTVDRLMTASARPMPPDPARGR
jgi:hypothetical protein